MKPNLHRRSLFILLICSLFVGLFSQSTFAQTCSQSQTWYWPVPYSKSMSRGIYYNSSDDYHNGIDITGGTGQKIVAAADGIVIAVFDGCSVSPGAYKDHSKCNPVAHYLSLGDKWGLRSPNTYGYCNYGVGKGVFVDHGNGVWSRYQHMDTVNVSVGQCVTGGVTQLGTMGAYGYATGAHLHFEITTSSSFTNSGYWNGTSLNNQPCGSGYTRGTWNNVCGITYNHNYTPVGTLDLNGLLDGELVGSISPYGTAKVYINGTLASDGNDVADYNKQFDAGTTYRVVVTPRDGYSVDGTSEIEGMITANNISDVRFTINSIWLKVNGVLDGKASDSLNGCGTFDVVSLGTSGNDHVVIADDVSSFNQRMKVGTYFEISDIKSKDGFEYKGMTNSNGSVYPTGRFLQGGTTTITLAFDSKPLEPSCEWAERPFIPSNVNTDEWEIEVKNHYSQVSATSPGTGWTQTGSSTRYVVSGEPYTTYKDLGETSTRKFVENVWYHWCGYAGHSDWVELENAVG